MGLVTLIACTLLTAAALVIGLRGLGCPWRGRGYSQTLIDSWTLGHVGHGIVFYAAWRMVVDAAQVVFLAALLSEVLWELVENTPLVVGWFRRGGERAYRGDSIVNSLGDLAACATGALFVAFLL